MLQEKGVAINHVTMSVVRTVGECAVRAVGAVQQSGLVAMYGQADVAEMLNLYKDAVLKVG